MSKSQFGNNFGLRMLNYIFSGGSLGPFMLDHFEMTYLHVLVFLLLLSAFCANPLIYYLCIAGSW